MLTPIRSLTAMAEKAPYRLQIFLSDERRQQLRQAAHEEYTSMQKLVERILSDYLDQRGTRQSNAMPEEAEG